MARLSPPFIFNFHGRLILLQKNAAIKMINGLHVKVDSDEAVSIEYLSKVSGFKIISYNAMTWSVALLDTLFCLVLFFRLSQENPFSLLGGPSLLMQTNIKACAYIILMQYPMPFKLQEQYKAGEQTKMSRRDMRQGSQIAILRSLNPNEMAVELWWEGDLPGRVNERFLVNQATGELEVHGVMEVEGEKYEVIQKYMRVS